MAEQPKPQSWWQTLPGILTAAAAIITAITGLVVALHQVGFFRNDGQRPIQASRDLTKPPMSQPPREVGSSRTGCAFIL
jgi:hypothetical protein